MTFTAETGTIFHPDYGVEMAYRVDNLPDSPDGQVESTIDLMKGYVLADAPVLSVRVMLRSLQDQARDQQRPIEDVIFEHVKSFLVFRNDDETVERVFTSWNPERKQSAIEVLTRPVDTVRLINHGFYPREDCDGFSIYASALLTVAGIPNAFATVGADPEYPDNYSHVYVVAYPQAGTYAGKRIAFDCSHGAHLGWECPNRYGKFKEWPVYGLFDLMGLFKIVLIAGAAFYVHGRIKGTKGKVN